MNELQIELYGRVQGVAFRETVRKYARKEGVKGYVMNKDDGDVFVCAQGRKDKLAKLLVWLQESPGLSKVTGLTYHWKSSSQAYESFSVVKKNSFLIDQAKSFLNLGKKILGTRRIIPKHVAIIPDGNRRWAKSKGMQASFGHYYAGSYSHVRSLLQEAQRLGAHYLSLWGFSTENWTRESMEQKAIFELILRSIPHLREDAHSYKISFKHVGRKDRMPRRLLDELKRLEEDTARYRDFCVVLCLDYGGRDEIIRAIAKAMKSGKKISEKTFENYLDTKGIPDPDLVIRTSGEQRTSGFMPYQAAYSELYFSDKYFPDFGPEDLRKAIDEYGRRQRRFGS